MIAYLNSGKTKVVVDSTQTTAVFTQAQGGTEVLTTGGPVYVNDSVPDTLKALGWPPIPPPQNTAAPVVTGTPLPGSTLTCTPGVWDNQPTSYGYQWMSDANPVGFAQNSYVVSQADAGHTITCVVTATNEGGPTSSPPSNGIAIVDLAAQEAAALHKTASSSASSATTSSSATKK